MQAVLFLMAAVLAPAQSLALERWGGGEVRHPSGIIEPENVILADGVGVGKGPSSVRIDGWRRDWGAERPNRRRNRNVGAGSAGTAAPRFKAPPTGPQRRLEAGGNHRSYSVYGDSGRPAWRLGNTLPPGTPYAKLKHRSFGLPEPHDGQSWVRVEGAVMLIEDASREILWIVEQ